MEPVFVAPMQATLGPLPPDDGSWAAEVKWDGVRVVVATGQRTRCWSRAGNESTATWPEVSAGTALGGRSALLDGEVLAVDADGRPSFGLLQQRLGQTEPAKVAGLALRIPVVFMVFDLLAVDGRSWLNRSYDERRDELAGLDLTAAGWQLPVAHPDPPELLALTAARGLEGVVCKRRASTYRPGERSRDWVKTKNVRTQEVVIGGWRRGQGNREGGIGSLLLGVPGQGGLNYVGHVGTGFTEAVRAHLLDALTPLRRPASPFGSALPAADARDAVWVEPELVGEVAFGEWTGGGRLRHPVWRGLRPDKTVAQVVREEPG